MTAGNVSKLRHVLLETNVKGGRLSEKYEGAIVKCYRPTKGTNTLTRYDLRQEWFLKTNTEERDSRK